MLNRTLVRIALTAALVLALTLVPAAFAGKGGKPAGNGGGGGTLSLVLLNSTDGLPHFGQKVTFAVSTTATSQPWVVAKCYQNGVLVYSQANGIFPTSLGQIFTLGPTPAWSGGAADCSAYLQDWTRYSKGKVVTLASMNFHVYP